MVVTYKIVWKREKEQLENFYDKTEKRNVLQNHSIPLEKRDFFKLFS